MTDKTEPTIHNYSERLVDNWVINTRNYLLTKLPSELVTDELLGGLLKRFNKDILDGINEAESL